MNFHEKENPDKVPRFIYENYINQIASDGVFLELGAFDGTSGSNTLFFEKELDFNGVLIEPVVRNFESLVKNRPKCINLNLTVLNECSNQENIRVKKLGLILKELNVKYIDFWSLDVKGSESEVLKSMNWHIPVYLICLNMLDSNCKKINSNNESSRRILTRNGFRLESLCVNAVGRNEFWTNKEYFRKSKLYNPNKPYKSNIFSKIKKIFKK